MLSKKYWFYYFKVSFIVDFYFVIDIDVIVNVK